MIHDLMLSVLPNLPANMMLASREGITHMISALSNSPASEGWEEKFPLKHRFADGVYAREMFIPKGHIIIGKIHKYGHLNIITTGDVSVLTEFGIERIVGPITFQSLPGTQRVVYAHEDTVWTTLHGTQHTDPDLVEQDIISRSFEEYDKFVQMETVKQLQEEKQ